MHEFWTQGPETDGQWVKSLCIILLVAFWAEDTINKAGMKASSWEEASRLHVWDLDFALVLDSMCLCSPMYIFSFESKAMLLGS